MSKPRKTQNPRKRFLQGIRSQSGVSLVEMLVVILITAILAVSLSFAVMQALRFSQRGREEAFVRESLCLVFERFSEALGMAKDVKVNTDRDEWAAFYRLETGGVSFETNRFIRISETEYCATNLAAVISVLHAAGTNRLSMSGNATLDAIVGDIEAVHVRNKGGEFYQVALTACYPVKVKDGVVTNRVTVEGPVRLWNYEKK